MPSSPPKITSLPSRYEPLVLTFGDKAKTTFVPPGKDLEAAKRLLASAESAGQGKVMFLSAQAGTGKSTYIHSLEVFLPDRVEHVVRLPQPYQLPVAEIPGFLANLPSTKRYTVVNFDGREAPLFDEAQYRTFLGALNGVLRTRRDLIVLWPVTDLEFAKKLTELLNKVGGASAFGVQPIYELAGLPRDQYPLVLEKILQVANWKLEDAAISTTEVQALVAAADSVGGFLDSLQGLIAQRFNVESMGIEFPTLVIAISSGEPKIRELCRSIRRADSFYIEASRLMMYTKKSNVAEWWANRATDLKSALPYVIALFNAQLVSLSASSVVHSVLQFGSDDLKLLVTGVRADRGNARRVVASSELFKYATGEAVDNREYGSSVKDETYESFERIQIASETMHRSVNAAILKMLADAGAIFNDLELEKSLVPGLQSDATYLTAGSPTQRIALEFHHKAASESTNNKLAIYVLEKLQEYAINYGLAKR